MLQLLSSWEVPGDALLLQLEASHLLHGKHELLCATREYLGLRMASLAFKDAAGERGWEKKKNQWFHLLTICWIL